MIPDSFKADLLDRVDLAAVIGQTVELKNNGAWLKGLCPFHDEKTPSFAVSKRNNFFHCFGCGEHGNAIDWQMRHHGMTFLEAVKSLASTAGMQMPDGPPLNPDLLAELKAERTAREILKSLETELTIAVIAVSDARKGIPISDEDNKRFLLAITKMLNGISEAKGEKKRAIAAAILTEQEEEELKEFAA